MGFTESLKRAAAEKLVPAPFREFLPYVSANALGVIHKEKVLGLALDIVGKYVSGRQFEDDVRETTKFFDSPRFSVVERLDETTPLGELLPEDRSLAGVAILEIYFRMIRFPIPLYLDLRPGGFGWDPAHSRLLWKPNRLRLHPSEEFRDRVRNLYRGFFIDDSEATKRGVELYRWESSPSDGFDSRIGALLAQHFGDARHSHIRFDTVHFRRTFALIFDEAIRSESRFHPELTFLGTALAGLYVSLKTIAEPLDVAKAYAAAMENTS